jgi:predicted Zn-ribbon and HTH transcriptional regulator
MGEQYCRGCGKHVDELGVTYPMQCPICGPKKIEKATYCGHCGKRLSEIGSACDCRKKK